MRLNLIDLLVIAAVLAVLIFAARQEFPHFQPSGDGAGEIAQ
jgi:hypothetical protein